MAPTLFTSCNALPPEEAELRLGRPGASFMAPTLFTSRTALPPEGAVPLKGGLSAERASTLATADASRGLAVRGRALRNVAPSPSLFPCLETE